MNTLERKRQLIAEGALYRAGSVIARASLRTQLRPAAVAKEAAPGLAAAMLSAWLGSGAMGAVGKLTPLVMAGVSAIANRKGAGSRALQLTAVGLAAGAAWVYLKRKLR